jgi:putative transposase
VHNKRNILNKVPSQGIPEVKAYLNSVYFAPDEKCAYREAEIFKDKFSSSHPSAVKCFDEDFAACIQHLKCPAYHRRSITSTNLVERSFLEEKRRSKAIPRFFDEKSGLKLVFASLIRSSQNWRRLMFTFEDQVNAMELREKLGHKAPEGTSSI